MNDVAICLTKAKTSPPALRSIKARISQLRKEFSPAHWRTAANNADEFFQYAYAPGTLQQLLYLREKLNWKESRVDNMLAALVLGSLHGEASSKRYLSNQMPRTISTKPRYSINFWKARKLVAPERDAFDVLAEMASLPTRITAADRALDRPAYRHAQPSAHHRIDFWPQPIKCAITSPPYP